MDAYLAQMIDLLVLGDGEIAVVTKLLADEEPRVRAGAAAILGCIGSDAYESSGDLLSLLEDTSEEVRGAAMEAVAKVAHPDAAIRALGRLEDGQLSLRDRLVGELTELRRYVR